MPTEAELLHAIVTQPEDMAPRLALAAHWGGDREKFVRGQIAASEAERAGKPGRSLDTDRLARGHERAWAGAIADHVRDLHFVRGFPEWVVVDGPRFTREWQQMFALAPIRQLDVTGLGAGDQEAFFACPGLAQIAVLSFDLAGTPFYSPVDDNIVMPIVSSPHLTNLRYLNLRSSKLTENGNVLVAQASNMPKLEVLLLEGMKEDLASDWDGSLTGARPDAAMAAFEAKFGRSEPLHYVERTGRSVDRAIF